MMHTLEWKKQLCASLKRRTRSSSVPFAVAGRVSDKLLASKLNRTLTSRRNGMLLCHRYVRVGDSIYSQATSKAIDHTCGGTEIKGPPSVKDSTNFVEMQDYASWLGALS